MVMEDIELLLSILIAGLSGILLIVSIAAFSRIKSIKLLLVGCAFMFFTIKGVLIILEYVSQSRIGMILDFVIVILLYFATVKK